MRHSSPVSADHDHVSADRLSCGKNLRRRLPSGADRFGPDSTTSQGSLGLT
jgi:hypothetical protein